MTPSAPGTGVARCSACHEADSCALACFWRSILTGWSHRHWQQDAGEMLEHRVAMGGPQSVKGQWEARIEQQGLLEIRRYATASVALTLDKRQSNEPTRLQFLMFTW